jgi:hypothetical protein
MPELILALLYVSAIASGALYVAGLCGSAPAWLSAACGDGFFRCSAPGHCCCSSLEEQRDKPRRWSSVVAKTFLGVG